MLRKLTEKNRKRLHRKIHIRKRIHGTAERPRMTVTRSNCNLYVQVINDDEGRTLAAISTLEKEFVALKPNVDGATKLGEALGKCLQDKKITTVVCIMVLSRPLQTQPAKPGSYSRRVYGTPE